MKKQLLQLQILGLQNRSLIRQKDQCSVDIIKLFLTTGELIFFLNQLEIFLKEIEPTLAYQSRKPIFFFEATESKEEVRTGLQKSSLRGLGRGAGVFLMGLVLRWFRSSQP